MGMPVDADLKSSKERGCAPEQEQYCTRQQEKGEEGFAVGHSGLSLRAGPSSPHALFGQGVGLGAQDEDLAVGAFGHAAIGMAVDTDFDPFDAVFLGGVLGRLYFLPCVVSANSFALRHHCLLMGKPGRPPFHWVD